MVHILNQHFNSIEAPGPFSKPHIPEMDSPDHCEHLQLLGSRSEALLRFPDFETHDFH
jgi:hypothetical protein